MVGTPGVGLWERRGDGFLDVFGLVWFVRKERVQLDVLC